MCSLYLGSALNLALDSEENLIPDRLAQNHANESFSDYWCEYHHLLRWLASPACSRCYCRPVLEARESLKMREVE